MNNNKIQYFVFFTCFLFILLLLASCFRSEKTYYFLKETISNLNFLTFVTDKESILHFSFSYPSYYSLTDETKGNVNPSLNVGLNGQQGNNNVKMINLHVTNYSPKWLGFPDADSEMNDLISERKWSFSRNYRLIEKRKAVVDGIEGQEIIVTFRERPAPNLGYGAHRDPMFVVARDLFINYQGMTWRISLYTDKDSYEKHTKEEFEYLLQTFKFNE